VTPSFDLAIVGSGFGGSLLALIARRLGRSVLLVERERHPRFAIGESASPLAGVVLEQLADRYSLPRIRPFASFGAWQRSYPEVVCGLKRGFSYFKHQRGERYRVAPERANQLLVAASPSDELSDTHWLRADVDHFLVKEACDAGVEYVDRTKLESAEWQPDSTVTLRGSQDGRPFRANAAFVVDASGPRGFLTRALGLEASAFQAYPATQALFSHFEDVKRCDDLPEFADVVGRAFSPRVIDGGLPFPIDDAALHHVFDEGWMWVLRFGNGVTSAGIAVTDAYASELRLSDGEPAWQRFLARYPSIASQFADARTIRPFTWMPRMASCASAAAGERWALLPSAAAFVDPLFSTGIPMTLLGIERLAAILEVEDVDRRRLALEEYDRTTRAEVSHVARFVAGCYAGFPRFEAFADYAMFYFAAASFSEMTRRLGGTPPGFLCAADPSLTERMDALSPMHGIRDRHALEIARSVERINVAGLCDPVKQNWYGVDLEDPVRHAAKLGAAASAVRAMLASLGQST
jgi:FADH2 O2-dependent halogenase